MQQRSTNRSRPAPQTLRWLGIVVVVVLLSAAGLGILGRYQAKATLQADAENAAIQAVATTRPKAGATTTELVLPGTVQAIIDAPIYARTNGYLKSFKVDIGSRVHRGQLLGEIDTPEVNDQLRQAQADLATAQANQAIARSTAQRWLTLLTTDSVTRQETDEKVADAKAKDAIVASAQANVARLSELQNFSQVTAPFDGIISARKTDLGALINAGSGQGVELFHLVDRSTLRVFVQVPQTYAASISIGQTAQLKFSQYPGRSFPAKLVRSAEAMDAAARTLLVEFQVDNSKGELLPGSYAEIHFTVPIAIATLRLPINTLIFRGDGIKVARLGADTKINLVQVTTGLDLGTEIEITSGIAAFDDIILSPPDSLVEGQTVRVVDAPAKAG